jgi:hypothetical protein
MKVLITIFIFGLISSAYAEVSIQIVQQRNPSQAKSIYQAKCKKQCDLRIKTTSPKEGTVTTSFYKSKIEELFKLKKQGSIPSLPKGSRTLYEVKAVNNKDSLSFRLSYPKSYKSPEYTNYSQVVQLLEELKRSMSIDLVEDKK